MADDEVSSSDSEDEEYFPEGAAPSSGSDVSEGERDVEEEEERGGKVVRGRQQPAKLGQTSRKKPLDRASRKRSGGICLEPAKRGEKGEEEEEEEEEEAEEEEEVEGEEEERRRSEREKTRVDDLWASFMNDTSSKATTTTAVMSAKLAKPEMVKIRKSYDFAGEEIVVEKTVEASSKEAREFPHLQSGAPSNEAMVVRNVSTSAAAGESPHVAITIPADMSTQQSTVETPAANQIAVAGTKRRSGLSSVLSSLQKKPKMSILDKSSLDWSSYKQREGLEDELATQRKDGFLQKQAFLQRVDQREFELQREERMKRFRRLH